MAGSIVSRFGRGVVPDLLTQRCFYHRKMRPLTTQILRFDSLPSTNLEAASRAIQGAPEGLCIVASEQTAGRGRLERQWVSPKDAGLYFSIILRPQFEQGFWPLLTLMAAVAVHDALLDAVRHGDRHKVAQRHSG